MKRKGLLVAGMVAVMTLAGTFTSLAGEWKQLEGGAYWQWWYVNDDGGYTKNNWQQIDGKWYHFDSEGYLDVGNRFINEHYYFLEDSGAMATNKTTDTGIFGADGAWTETLEPVNYWISTEAEMAAWKPILEKYGVTNLKAVALNDTTYTYSAFFDISQGLYYPDIQNVLIQKALMDYSGFDWQFSWNNGVYTLTITNTFGY